MSAGGVAHGGVAVVVAFHRTTPDVHGMNSKYEERSWKLPCTVRSSPNCPSNQSRNVANLRLPMNSGGV